MTSWSVTEVRPSACDSAPADAISTTIACSCQTRRITSNLTRELQVPYAMNNHLQIW